MRFWKKIKLLFSEGWEEYERKHPRAACAQPRTSQDRLPGVGRSSDAASSRPDGEKALEIFCLRCGSRNVKIVSQTHRCCGDCGLYTRLEPTDADLRPPVEYTVPGAVRAVFRNGAVAIEEYDLHTGEILGSRPATKQDTQARPKPVAFAGIRAGRVN